MKYYFDYALEGDGMRTTGTSMEWIRYTELRSQEQREWDHLVESGLRGEKHWKTVMKEYALVARNGFVWFREHSSDNLLWTLKWREFV